MATEEEVRASIATAMATQKQLQKDIAQLKRQATTHGPSTVAELEAKLAAIQAKNTALQTEKDELEG